MTCQDLERIKMANKNDDRHSPIRCSFCGKSQGQVRKLISGPNDVYICDECVELCAEIVDEEFEEEGIRQSRENIRSYLANARLLTTALGDLGIWYCGGRNSPYVWMECPRGMTSWQFFDYLLSQANVVGTPGSGFGPNGEHYFRLTAFGDRKKTIEAVGRIAKL